MFERFTEEARRVVVLAQEEARALKHNYLGTEHILLGLLRVEEGLAALVLRSLGVGLERARAQIVRIVGSGEGVTSRQIAFTPRATKVLELALREAVSLGHNYICSEHILLGLARENEGVAARILLDFDADSKQIRNRVIQMLPGASHQPSVAGYESPDALQWIATGWIDGIGLVLNQLADEIRRESGREPDAGDLLLVLALARDSLSSRALEQLKVDVDELWGHVERLRDQARAADQQLADQIAQARRDKQRAIESQEFQAAAAHRDQERRLTQQQRAQKLVSTEALQAIRLRLGLPTPSDPPTTNGD